MSVVGERSRSGVALPERWRFTVEDYHRLGEVGIFAESDRVELIEGEILTMTPIGARHAACLKRLIAIFSRLGDRAAIGAQDPIRLSDASEPQPDLSVARPRDDFYEAGHPGPSDLFLVVEVSDATLAYDRGVKAPLYARHGVPETWIVDLAGGVIEAYTDPGPDGYRSVTIRRRGETISPGAFPDASIPVDEILGARAAEDAAPE